MYTVSEIKGRFLSKIANFPHPRVFNARGEGFLSEFCNGGGTQNKLHRLNV